MFRPQSAIELVRKTLWQTGALHAGTSWGGLTDVYTNSWKRTSSEKGLLGRVGPLLADTSGSATTTGTYLFHIPLVDTS